MKAIGMGLMILASVAATTLVTVNSGCEVSGPLDLALQLDDLSIQTGSAGSFNPARSSDDGLLHNLIDDHGGHGTDNGASHDITDDHTSTGPIDGSTNGASAPNTPIFSRLFVRLTGMGIASGAADYRNRGTRQQLKIAVEDVQPGSVMSLTVAGVELGTLTAGPLGRVEVEFDTRLELGHVAWPANLPKSLAPGTNIEVNGLSGALAIPVK